MRAIRGISSPTEAVGVAAAVPVLVARADDPADVPEQAADAFEQLLADDRVRLHQGALFGVERAGLLDDLVRNPDLPDVVQQRDELAVATSFGVEAEPIAHAEHEVDDVAAVAAGVGVVGLDHVAEQKRGAAVRVAQLERVIDAPAPLAREVQQQSD